MTNIKRLPVGQTFPINAKLAGIVPMALEAEQATLTEDIRANGLREPVVLWKGEIVDGRCRQLACTVAGVPIDAKELDEQLTEAEVRVFVKSVNTRRNLTATQKIMSACRISLEPGAESVKNIAKAWGIGETVLKNARYIAKTRPEFVDPLFNGKGVEIVSSDGTSTVSNKISAIYAYVRREAQNVTEDTQHGWQVDTNINTQAGKDWYYSSIRDLKEPVDVRVRIMMAELANYKFPPTEDMVDLEVPIVNEEGTLGYTSATLRVPKRIKDALTDSVR